MSYEPPPQRPAFNPPPDPGYAAADYDQRQAGQPGRSSPTRSSSHRTTHHRSSSVYPPQQSPKKKRHWVRNTFLGLAGFIVLIVIISVAANGCSNGTSAAGSGAAPANAVPAAPQVAKIGTPVRDGKFQFTITSVSHAVSVGDTADGFGDTAQGKYTILHVTVTNISSQPQTLFDSNQYVFDASGRKYDVSTSADMDINGASDSVLFNDINPGNTVRGELAFDMPAGLKAVKAELHDSAFSGGVTVKWR